MAQTTGIFPKLSDNVKSGPVKRKPAKKAR